jgi:hypothetical protein
VWCIAAIVSIHFSSAIAMAHSTRVERCMLGIIGVFGKKGINFFLGFEVCCLGLLFELRRIAKPIPILSKSPVCCPVLYSISSRFS